MTVNTGCAVCQVVKPRYKVAECGFSAAGRTDNRNVFARTDMKTKMAQNIIAVVVLTKADIIKVYFTDRTPQ